MLGEDGHLCISLRILSIKTPCLVRIYSTLSRSCVRRGTLLGRKVEGVHVWGNGVGEGEGKWLHTAMGLHTAEAKVLLVVGGCLCSSLRCRIVFMRDCTVLDHPLGSSSWLV